MEVSVGRRWKWGGEREGKGGGMCMHIYVHLLQRKSAAARGSEVFRAEAHRVAVAPGVGVGRGMMKGGWVRRGGGRRGGAASPARVDKPLPDSEAVPEARRRCGEAPRVPELCIASGLAAPVAALAQVMV